MEKCSDCGKTIQRGQPRWLVYKHQFSSELVYRYCENCANEDWKKEK